MADSRLNQDPARAPLLGAQQNRSQSPIGRVLSKMTSVPSDDPRRVIRDGRGPAAAPVRPLSQHRTKDKIVPLPVGSSTGATSGTDIEPSTRIFEDVVTAPPTVEGRIAIYCIAESLNRKVLEQLTRSAYPEASISPSHDVLCTSYPQMEKLGSGEHLTGDIFFFDYGAVVFWGLNEAVEAEILNTVAYPAQETPYDPAEVESDTFGTMWSVTERPNISNDTFTLSRRSASDQDVKISISHALAQSTKLCVYEKRISELVSDTKDFPEMLALQGKVMASRKQIAQLIGKVFIQKSQVNLLSTVLDTPEFFWSADDSLQALYKRVCEYLELDTRVEVLNNRYQVLTEMLNIVRDHENNSHTARLEWIVIWLIVIEVVVGLFECASILGWVGRRGG